MPKKKDQESPCTSTSNFNDVLECPVCLKIPNSLPVFQCKAGHIACNDCHPRMKKCPICRMVLGKIRSRLAEALISRLPSICQFEGCSMQFMQDELKEHANIDWFSVSGRGLVTNKCLLSASLITWQRIIRIKFLIVIIPALL